MSSKGSRMTPPAVLAMTTESTRYSMAEELQTESSKFSDFPSLEEQDRR